jgi:hypothetical protein
MTVRRNRLGIIACELLDAEFLHLNALMRVSFPLRLRPILFLFSYSMYVKDVEKYCKILLLCAKSSQDVGGKLE